MRKLLRANFARLWRSKAFWLMMAAMAAAAVFICFDRYNSSIQAGIATDLDPALFSHFMFIGSAIAIFASLFFGTEYSDGTLRNKLIAGCRRRDIYLANLLTCLTAGVLMVLAYAIVICAIGLALIGGFSASIPALLLLSCVCIIFVAALSSIFMLIATLLPNKAISSILCLAISIALLISAAVLYSRMQEPEFHTGAIVLSTDEDGNIRYENPDDADPIPNPLYLTPDQRKVYQLILNVLPTGQGLQMMEMIEINPWLFMLYSAIITTLVSALGLLFFKRKDIK